MSLIAEAGTFSSPGSTGNDTVALSNFTGVTPKVLIVWASHADSTDGNGPLTTAALSFGVAASSTERAVVAIRSENGQATSDSWRYQDNTKVATILDSGGTRKEEADFVSFGTNEFTLNWTTVDSVHWRYNYLALGGDDLTDVYLDAFLSPTSNGSQARTGVGFEPTSLITFSTMSATAGPLLNTWGILGLGIHDGTNSTALAVTSRDAVGTSDTVRAMDSSFVHLANADGTTWEKASVTSLDSDGYTLDWTTTRTTAAIHYVLCLRGPQMQRMVVNQPATNTTATRSVGFAPKAALSFSAMAPSSASINDDGRAAVGGWDSSNKQASAGWMDANGQATTDADCYQNNATFLSHYDHTQTLKGSMTAAASGTDLIETWTSVDGTQREHAMLVFGDAFVLPPPADGIPYDEALPVKPYCAFDWMAFYPGLWKLPDAGITVTGTSTIVGAVNDGGIAANVNEATFIHLPDNDCELWFNLSDLNPDYWQTHHFDFRIHGRRTDAAQGNTSHAQLYMQIFEADGTTAISEEAEMNAGGLNETWENKFIQDVERTGRSKWGVLVNAKVRLRQKYNGGDANELAQIAAYTTYVPIEVKEYTAKPIGDGTNNGYGSTEATRWEAIDAGVDTPDDAKNITLTSTDGDAFFVMGPAPPADFYQALHMQTEVRWKVSTVAGNRHTLSIGHFTEDETTAFAGGTSGMAPNPNTAETWLEQSSPDVDDTNAVGSFYDWNEQAQINTFAPAAATYDDGAITALTNWRLNLGSTNDNGVQTISEAETEIKYSALSSVSYVGFERLFPAADATIDGPITSTESTLWEAINTRVQLSDNTKYVTLPDADASVFFDLSAAPKDLGTVHHFIFWLKYARKSASGEHSDLFMQLFAADESTALSNELLMTKDVAASTSSWEHHSVAGIVPTTAVDSTIFGSAKLRIRQDYRDGEGMKVTAASVEVHYNPKELESIVLKPADDLSVNGITSTEAKLWEALTAGVNTPNDAKFVSANAAGQDARFVMAPAVPTDFFQVLDYQIRFRARQSDVSYPNLTPAIELHASDTVGTESTETLLLDEDVDVTWGDYTKLAADDATAITIGNGDDDTQIFGFAAAARVFLLKSISKLRLFAKGEAANGPITLYVSLKINEVWTTVEPLLFAGGVQTLSVEWDGYELSSEHLATVEVQVWADGLSVSDTFDFEWCYVEVVGNVPAQSTQLNASVAGAATVVDTWTDFETLQTHSPTAAGFHSTHSRSIEGTGGSLADRDAWLWPIVTVADDAAYGSGGDFDVSEIEITVWFSALQSTSAGIYLFRLMQGMNTMIRDVINQRWWVYAFDVTTGLPKTGDAANITANIYQNNGGAVATDTANPTEIAGGFYTFPLTQAETAADTITLVPTSSTENVSVVPTPAVVSPHPANFGLLGIETDGDLTKVNTLHGHTAQTADNETRLAAAAATLAAQDVILGNLPNAGSLSDLATIKNRIGAFAGTGVNTILGFLKALGNKDATDPSELVDGGTFAAASHSTQAIRIRGDAAYVPPSTGSGAYDVDILVEDEAGNPLGGAQVRMVLGASVSEGQTAADGTLTLKCNNGSWSIGITHVTSVSYSGTVVVDGDTTVPTFELPQTVTADPSDAGRSTGQILLMTNGSPDVGAEYSIKYSRGGDLAGVSPDRSIMTATANASGIAQFPNLIHNAYYTLLGRGDGTAASQISPFAKRSADRLGEFQVPVTSPFSITE